MAVSEMTEGTMEKMIGNCILGFQLVHISTTLINRERSLQTTLPYTAFSRAQYVDLYKQIYKRQKKNVVGLYISVIYIP